MRRRLYHFGGIAMWMVALTGIHFYSCNEAGPTKSRKKQSYNVITKDSVPDASSIEYLTYCCQNNIKIKPIQLGKFLPGIPLYPDSIRLIFADKTSFTNSYSDYFAKTIHIQKKGDETDFVYLTVFNNNIAIHCELLGTNTMFNNGHSERLDVHVNGNQIHACQYYYTGSMDSIVTDSVCSKIQVMKNGKIEKDYDWTEIKLTAKEQMEFWNYAVKPIIDSNKAAVIETVLFPLEGDWSFMVMGKEDYSKKNFIKYYDKLFNTEVRGLLKKQNYRHIYASRANREITVEFSVSKDFYMPDGTQMGGASLIFRYKKINGQYKMYAIYGAGGGFY